MKVLLDQNLSPRLCEDLKDLLPHAVHVRDVGLESADDLVVWTYARQHGLTIVTKDADFNNLAFLLGAPPKVVWIKLGNCSTSDIEALLRTRQTDWLEFEKDADAALLALA